MYSPVDIPYSTKFVFVGGASIIIRVKYIVKAHSFIIRAQPPEAHICCGNSQKKTQRESSLRNKRSIVYEFGGNQ